MRIRSIKPEFWRSDDVSALNAEDRLLFIGLWSYVDDNGVGVDKLATVAADLFASDIERDPSETFARVSRGLQNLFEGGLIERYEANGKRFLHITNWEKHQRIDKPNKPRYPLPTSDNAILATPSRESPETPAPGAVEQRSRGAEEQSSTSPKPEKEEKPVRPEVEALCALLADRVEANGARRPNITKAWRDDARLLMDQGNYTPEQVAYVINWATSDDFWSTNILSMKSLRGQFEKLKLKAIAEKKQPVSKTQREIDEWMSKPLGAPSFGTSPYLEVTQ